MRSIYIFKNEVKFLNIKNYQYFAYLLKLINSYFYTKVIITYQIFLEGIKLYLEYMLK